jgi:elongation factor P
MALTNQFVKDMYLMIDGQIHHVLDRQYKTQGRQGGLMILKMKNLSSGNIVTQTHKSGFKIEQIEVETVEVQYLYKDPTGIYFMDMNTFETVSIPAAIIGSYVNYLKEGDKVLALTYNGKFLNIKQNVSVNLLVTETYDAVKGNTSTNAMKDATVETGYKLKVPLFIQKGDKISINTDSGEYTGRIND